MEYEIWHTVLDIEMEDDLQSFTFHMEYETWHTISDIEIAHDT